MACFLVSAAEAAVVTVVEKAEKKKEERHADSSAGKVGRIPLSIKLRWLKYMLCGGAVLLAFEHIWHGEVVPWFPFLTAMSDSAEAAVMFREMATVGVSMALLITAVWIGMCVVGDIILRRPEKDAEENTAV